MRSVDMYRDDAISPPKELERTPREREGLYVALHLKLFFVVAIALTWASLSFWFALPWIEDLASSITLPLALAVIFGIAIVPGYLNANLIASLLIDRPPPLRFDLEFPALTVVIACFEEEESIEETIDYVAKQEYPGELHILVADDGSPAMPRSCSAPSVAGSRVTVPRWSRAGAGPSCPRATGLRATGSSEASGAAAWASSTSRSSRGLSDASR